MIARHTKGVVASTKPPPSQFLGAAFVDKPS
jgi:hypothetical protein